jgi:RNA polymerase sigma-70 factor (ECF subfamily)
VDPRQDRHQLATVFEHARAGDARAFRTLIEALAPEIVRFVTSLLRGDVESAHDVAQDVFVRAWRALPTLHDADHFRRWAFRVARCKAISHLRGPGARLRQHARLPDDGEHGRALASREVGVPDAVKERPPVYAALRAALHRLPPDYGAAIELHYLRGYALRETADLLGVTLPAVKMRLVRARASLRRLLGPATRTTRRLDATPASGASPTSPPGPPRGAHDARP